MSTAPAFTIHRDVLQPLLSRVDKAVEKRDTIPILKHVRLDARADGLLSITATDLDIKAEASIPGAEVEREGATTVDSKTFLASIKNAPSGPVAIDTTDRELTIKAGRSKAKMLTQPASDFPDIGGADSTHDFVIPALDLTAMRDKCGFAISTEETRYYLNGIYCHVHDGKLVAVASDGARLSELALDLPDGAQDMPGVIIPRRMVNLFDLLADKDDRPVSVALSDRFIRFAVPNLTVTSKLIDGTFPDYRSRAMRFDNPHRAKIPAQALEEALERLAIYAETKYRSVRFDFTPGLLRLSSGSTVGTATDEVEIEGDFSLSIGFNSKFLLDLVKTFRGASIGFALAGSSDAPMISDPGDDRRTAVVSPVALERVE